MRKTIVMKPAALLLYDDLPADSIRGIKRIVQYIPQLPHIAG